MNEKIFNTEAKTDLLAQIGKGMAVYGRNGEKIGKVDKVHMSRSLPEQNHRETDAFAQDMSLSEEIATSFPQLVETLFDPQDEVEEVIQKRLYRHGFIRVDAKGLLAGDRYIMADDIEMVENGEVHLSLKRDEIFKGQV
jgi:hypothetical protein